MPIRVQMTRHKKWRPEHPTAVRIDRNTKWGNPFRIGHAQLRFPREDGREQWEFEGRLHKRSGERHAFHHGDYTLREDGSKLYRVTWHDVRDATVEECVALYREQMTGNVDLLKFPYESRVEEIRRELAGRDLACWCKPGDPCHGDVLLELANGPRS